MGIHINSDRVVADSPNARIELTGSGLEMADEEPRNNIAGILLTIFLILSIAGLCYLNMSN